MIKMILRTCFVLFSIISTAQNNYQREVQNPNNIATNISGKVTKIELTSKETILHFKVNSPKGSWISIPKKTYIEDSSGRGEKVYITKTEGITLTGRNYMKESGEIRYKLFFPPLSRGVTQINYGEANQGGNWFIYKLDVSRNGQDFLNSNKNTISNSYNIKTSPFNNEIDENVNNYHIYKPDSFKNLKDDSLLPKDLPQTFFGSWYDKYGSVILITTPDYIVYKSKIQYYQFIRKTSDTKFSIETMAGTFEILDLKNNILSIRTNKLSTLNKKPLNNKVPKELQGNWQHWSKIKRIKITDTHFFNNDGGAENVYGTIKSKIDQVVSLESGKVIWFVIYDEGYYSLYIVRKLKNEYILSPRDYANAKYKKLDK
jgi:hypothetical protein